MTHCRTECGAEINYKRVHFSSPVDWYDIPMEGDVIHDCPKLKPSTNDGANDVLKELEFMHKTLDEFFLDGLKLTYGLAEYSDLIDLPQELKMHSKEKLAERINVYALGGEMPREDFDKLPKSKKDDYKEFFGVEPPNQTPEERQADFRLTINDVMSFLQRCTDRFPAPFYRYGGYSQLELFRIFLESTEQYADAMNCHIIQGAVDTAKSQTNADAFIEVAGRLQKKLEEQRLAKEWTPEDTLAQKKWLMKTGMDEEKAESEAEFNRDVEQQAEEDEQKYPISIMNWALDLYKNRFEKFRETIGQDTAILEEEIKVDDTVDKEQSVDEASKPSSQTLFGKKKKQFREFIQYLYDDDTEIIWANLPVVHEDIKMNRKRQEKSLYKPNNESDLAYATHGELVTILKNHDTRERAKEKGIKNYNEALKLCEFVLADRNALDHDEIGELPPGWAEFNRGACTILDEFFDDVKHR